MYKYKFRQFLSSQSFSTFKVNLKMLKILSIFHVAIICTVSCCNLQNFRDAQIIPDIIHDFEIIEMVNVSFLTPLECGSQLTPNEVTIEPDITWNANENELFTILMTDSGVHSSDNNVNEVKHWLVVNIPGNNIMKGDKIVEYVGAMPMEVIILIFTNYF